ncbi:glycosyl hydrolase [Paenarthrobacter sp. Z7-10]|uniref:glycoside hydrolase family 76 protein n=1 Tax=Paenarthrobacter sp. Z7-10 TaxID=2787635 RepID=UPI0022A8D5B5|nr:glycoside hydrolase family 76 protein [Paenarthrobacter sp. Z7-10]MCZ2402832.1 glycosyl hydrolase [Paenarthrobacter sp. Z7-10]
MRTEASEWTDRAQIAAEAVQGRFGHRLIGLPGTWIASVQHPAHAAPAPWTEWHYWWQAHYMDALVDWAGRRQTEYGEGLLIPGSGGRRDVDAARASASVRTRSAAESAKPALPAPLLLAGRLLRTIRIRNYLRLTNSYYDDMAWLALAAGRATSLARGITGSDLPGARRAIHTLGGRLVRGHTQDLGGGTFWSTARDFKNTPATAPSALFFVRSGERERALRLADWLRRLLYDPEQGLYMDGVHPHPDGPVVERTIYSYNQGPILAALLELGGERHLSQAAELIDAVALRLTEPSRRDDGHSSGGAAPSTSRPLRLHGGGDGGLFTGILVRHLVTAACWPGLPADARTKATALVLDTAESLRTGRGGSPHPVFSSSISCPAGQDYPDGAALQLSPQLQAWTIFEAAYRLTSASLENPEGRRRPGPPSRNN